MAINPELAKLTTEVRYAEEISAQSFICYPTTGNLSENEIATSTLVLDALNIPHELNEVVHLSISVDGKNVEKDFVLSGFWDGYQFAYAQEAWVSKAFADEVAPAAVLPYEQTEKQAGLYFADINFSHPWDVRGQFDALCADAGIPDYQPDGVNPSYQFIFSEGELDIYFIVALTALLGTILLTGYLIIYNLFYILVTQDVHFFGLLRTIGASSKQLKGIVRM